MTPGKLCSQAGHAYLGAFQAAQGSPEHEAYASLCPGTKVCLQGNLAELGRAVEKAKERGIPHFLVIDSGCPNFFQGEPVLTALGFGPCNQAAARKLTKGLKLL